MTKFHFFLVLTLLLAQAPAHAACSVSSASGAPRADVLAKVFAGLAACPAEVGALRAALTHDGLTLTPTMVANRGFHNPRLGSFSFFETATGASSAAGRVIRPGEFFFGHFTTARDDGSLDLAQDPRRGALMVELIAWDEAHGTFRFYELIGDGAKGNWFYRGDSRDIDHDVRALHLQSDPARPEFGNTLRCAGCHTNGGPILKELALPHNDWWSSARPLPLGDRHPTPAMATVLKDLVDADHLARAVHSGTALLEGRKDEDARSLPERLRPLFCPVEVNFESDSLPAEVNHATVKIPAAFFVDPRLAEGTVEVSAADYRTALGAHGSQFPETNRDDADHAWLTPVKAASDQAAIATLRKSGLVDEAFELSILGVDFTNPVASAARCSLLRLVPKEAGPGWQAQFREKLRKSGTAAAGEALRNLEDPVRTPAWQKERAARYLAACAARAQESSVVADWASLLGQRRAEIGSSEISKNPRGQILEPGFRVIFPEFRAPAKRPLALNENCGVEP